MFPPHPLPYPWHCALTPLHAFILCLYLWTGTARGSRCAFYCGRLCQPSELKQCLTPVIAFLAYASSCLPSRDRWVNASPAGFLYIGVEVGSHLVLLFSLCVTKSVNSLGAGLFGLLPCFSAVEMACTTNWLVCNWRCYRQK